MSKKDWNEQWKVWKEIRNKSIMKRRLDWILVRRKNFFYDFYYATTTNSTTTKIRRNKRTSRRKDDTKRPFTFGWTLLRSDKVAGTIFKLVSAMALTLEHRIETSFSRLPRSSWLNTVLRVDVLPFNFLFPFNRQSRPLDDRWRKNTLKNGVFLMTADLSFVFYQLFNRQPLL